MIVSKWADLLYNIITNCVIIQIISMHCVRILHIINPDLFSNEYLYMQEKQGFLVKRGQSQTHLLFF